MIVNNEKSFLNHYDIGYSVLWDKNDLNNISKRFKEISHLTTELKLLNANIIISEGYRHLTNPFIINQVKDEIDIIKKKKAILVKDFENQIERYYFDQTCELEPLDVNRQEDRVVNAGMGKIAEFVVGESSQFFDHFASGTSTTPVYPADTALLAENARVPIETSGYATASGAVIKYGAYFPPTIASCSVSEAGVFDDPILGNMLFRTVYPTNKVIIHTQNSTFYTLSHAIYQSSL